MRVILFCAVLLLPSCVPAEMAYMGAKDAYLKGCQDAHGSDCDLMAAKYVEDAREGRTP